MRGHVCSVIRARRPQWVSRSVVCIRLQVPDLVLVHHPNQVDAKHSRLEIALTRATFG